MPTLFLTLNDPTSMLRNLSDSAAIVINIDLLNPKVGSVSLKLRVDIRIS